MKAAPYTRETLDRIRGGARASDLGWDQPFYLTVCKRHELIAMSDVPSLAYPKTAAPQPIVHHCLFDEKTGVVTRDRASVELASVMAQIFGILARLKSDQSMTAGRIGAQCGPGLGTTGTYLSNLRSALRRVELKIPTKPHLCEASYYLIDAQTEERAMVLIQPSNLAATLVPGSDIKSGLSK